MMETNNRGLVVNTDKSVKSHNTGDLVGMFINQLDRAPHTISTYKQALQKFVSYVEKRGVEKIDKLTIRDFRDHMKNKEKKTALTVNTYIAGVRSFFDFLEEQGIHKNITKGVRSLKRAKGFLREEVGDENMHKMFNEWEFKTIQDTRDFALLRLLAFGGARRVEVVRAQIGDIVHRTDSEGVTKRVLLVQGKGSDTKDEIIPLDDRTYIPLRNYLAATKRNLNNRDDYLFLSHSDRNPGEGISTRSVSRIAAKHLTKAGIKNERRCTHSFRHSFATNAFRKGGRLRDVQKALRHKNINNTLMYVHDLDAIDNPIFEKINYDPVTTNEEVQERK